MSSKRAFYIMIGLLIVTVLGLVGSTFAATKTLQQRADKLVELKAKHQTLENEEANLQKAKKDIEKYESLNAIAKTVVPQDKDQAQAVREIVNIAAANGVRLGSITFAASTLGGTGTSGSASGVKKTPITQVQPVPNIPGVYQLPITVQQDTNRPITYAQFIAFLSSLENNRRTAQVSGINIQPTTDRSRLTFTLQLNEYIKP